MVRAPPAETGDASDVGSIPGLGGPPGGGDGNPPRCSCLENSTDRGAWQAIIRGVAELTMTEGLSTHT